MRNRLLALAAMLLAVVAPAAASDLEDTLRGRWLGAWVLTGVEAYSACDGAYTNNDVVGTRVTSRGSFRFAAGELARVDKLSLKTSRVDLYLSVAEPLLAQRQEGQFTLFDERSCRVQLLVDIAGKDVRAGNLDAINAAIARAVSDLASREAALESPAWNRRVREPLPADYPETLARYEVWRAEQVNARVAEVRERAIDEADRIVDRLDDEPAYLEGLAAGVAAVRHASPPSCEAIATGSPAFIDRQAPRERRGDAPEQRAWRQGYLDGQALVFNLALARAAGGCFLVPPAPGNS